MIFDFRTHYDNWTDAYHSDTHSCFVNLFIDMHEINSRQLKAACSTVKHLKLRQIIAITEFSMIWYQIVGLNELKLKL